MAIINQNNALVIMSPRVLSYTVIISKGGINMYKSYTFTEYNKILEQDHINIRKFNNIEYKKIILLASLCIHNNLFIYAASEADISNVAAQILSLLMVFAKYGCMCMGIKSIIENALQGADFKQATTSGLQYFLIYILLSFYPKLFTMIKL